METNPKLSITYDENKGIVVLCDKKPLQNVKSVCITQRNDVSIELSIRVDVFIESS